APGPPGFHPAREGGGGARGGSGRRRLRDEMNLARSDVGDEFGHALDHVEQRLAIADRRIIETGPRRNQHTVPLREHYNERGTAWRRAACAVEKDDSLALPRLAIMQR